MTIKTPNSIKISGSTHTLDLTPGPDSIPQAELGAGQACLVVNQLTKYFIHNGSKTVLFDGVNATFKQGNTYAITGASGSGKSTFMHLLAGLENPCSGSVDYNNKNITTLTRPERTTFLSSAVGLMFQQPYLLAELSVVENVIVPGLISGKNKTECMQEAGELLAQLELEHKADHKPRSLSGGQQQRVALARALFNKPAFLLADEPTGSLDTKTGQCILALLLSLQKKYSMGIILSTHDASVAKQMDIRYHLANQLLSKV